MIANVLIFHAVLQPDDLSISFHASSSVSRVRFRSLFPGSWKRSRLLNFTSISYKSAAKIATVPGIRAALEDGFIAQWRARRSRRSFLAGAKSADNAHPVSPWRV